MIIHIMDSNVKKNLWLTLSALGVVYGDLGTSPLYALQQTLSGEPINLINVFGVVSLVFWSLVLVISTRYVTLFLRADNNGEGGILALLSLLKRQGQKFPRFLFFTGIIGAGLLLGDGMLTPAISVISALEGLKVVSPAISHLIVPISFIILLILFLCQRFGTAKIGFSFGPILFCWFIIIGILGVISILHTPKILLAINPYYAFEFFYHGGWHAYILLGGVFLVITGAEAMYADLGHFGKTPIRLGWFVIVFPTLLLNYFGQGAYLLQSHQAHTNCFYALAPNWFSLPLLIIATLATIIASQAVISASFSLIKQAILLNICPRLSIIHTSKETIGQVYIPQINFILAVGTLLLVVIFKTSSALAAAYGMAVNLVMIIMTLLILWVAHLYWRWSIPKIIRVFALFALIDFAFLGANAHKIQQGAWIPIAFAIAIGTIMITWEKGMETLRSNYYLKRTALPELIKNLDSCELKYLEKLTAIFITDAYDESGGYFLQYLKLIGVFPQKALVVSVVIDNYPYVSKEDRFEFKMIDEGIYSLKLHYGFMQHISVVSTLLLGKKMKIYPFPFRLDQSAFLMETVNIIITKKKNPHLFLWQKKIFAFIMKNSNYEIEFFRLPHDRTIAIGTYCEL